MAVNRSRIWAIVVLVLVLGAAAGVVTWRYPLLLPGDHTVAVYAVNDNLSGPADREPGVLGRLLGMCDGDSYYVRAAGRATCLVLSGPLGKVRARRTGATVTVPAADAAALRRMAAQDTGSPDPTTQVVLRRFGRPVAMVPVADIADGAEVHATAVH
jgi:hypothetical protein